MRTANEATMVFRAVAQTGGELLALPVKTDMESKLMAFYELACGWVCILSATAGLFKKPILPARMAQFR